MMLGWPSLAYPLLLHESNNPPILINIDDSSLIAGFLMEGNSIGVLFSTSKFLGSKTAVFLCCCLQFIGWFVMFGANDIFGLLISRVSVGFGNGCGTGHLKRYIKETCEPELADKLMHYIPVGINIGIVLIYSVGAFVDFRKMAIFGMMFPMLAMFSFGVIPKRTLTAKRASITKTMFKNAATLELDKIEDELNKSKADEADEHQINVLQCLRDKRSRNGLLLIFLIVFMQQYTGGPANIVYSQIIFKIANNPNAKICSIIYSIFFLIFTIISLKFVRNFPRKANLLIGSGSCVIIIGTLSLYYFLKEYLLRLSHLFAWSPLFIMTLFNAFHTFSMGTVPLYIILEKIPKRSRNVASKFLVIHFSMSAVISTKIFQVLYAYVNMSVAYAFFVCVALVGFFLLLIFMDEYNVEEEKKLSAQKCEETIKIECITRL
ncbi:facilitated trehalose transporter tret1-1-related [Holotrichia oblita]|uniref:Facilitated trehalose transporter tret1-1-related n=1 Tax=Holotrichia oblita TaxID=644536 RepID=A0ACB9SPD7_HOLOL|nr:facilitated trehalose transporter tret1-1-related [Holotrichia oblita]